jgi:hypothetical protein
MTNKAAYQAALPSNNSNSTRRRLKMTRLLALPRTGLVPIRDCDHVALAVVARDRVIDHRAVDRRGMVMRALLLRLRKCGAREHCDDDEGR